MSRRVFFAAWLCCLGFATVAPAQTEVLKSRDIIRALRTPIEMSKLQNPMALYEAVAMLHEMAAELGLLGKGVGLPILVDQAGFKEVGADSLEIYDTNIKFPRYPEKMTVASALQIALSQVSTANATYVIRRGTIVITPREHATIPHMLQQRVLATFEKKPLDEVLHELAEETGVSIQLDARGKEKPVLVTAVFRNDTSLRDVLTLVADLGNLQVVELPSAVYLTTPANAEALRKTTLKK